jgi:hypothetical protein
MEVAVADTRQSGDEYGPGAEVAVIDARQSGDEYGPVVEASAVDARESGDGKRPVVEAAVDTRQSGDGNGPAGVAPGTDTRAIDAWVIDAPEGSKDPNDLHRRGAADFAAVFGALMADARPLRPPPESAKKLSASYREVVEAERNLPFLSAREVATATPDKADWIIDGLAGRGILTELDAKIKLGKTTLLTMALRQVLDGADFLGLKTTKTGVIYLSEQSATSFRSALERAKLLDRDDFVICFWSSAAGLPWPEIVRQSAEEARRRGFGVLVVDTLSQFAGVMGDGENTTGVALEAMKPLQEVAANLGLCVIVLRHERKAGGDVGESARGASAFGGAVDIILSLRRGEGNSDPNVRILRSLSRFDETPAELVISFVDGAYIALGSAEEVKAQLTRKKLVEVLPTTEDDALDLKSIVDQIKATRSHVQEVLDADLIGGKVSRVGLGKRGDPFRYWRVTRSEPRRAVAESTIPAPAGTEFLSASTTSLYEAERNGGQTGATLLSASTTSLYQAERNGGETSAPNEILRMTV